MNCSRIRELILTDYSDGQMDIKRETAVKEHLARCPGCKEFSMTVKKAAIAPFLNTDKVNPPEFIWPRIKEAIIAGERKKTSFAADLLGKIRSIMYIPKPALALATLMTLILIIGVIVKSRVDNYNVAARGQIEYFDYSAETMGGLSADSEEGFGTLVEAYFM